MEIAIIPHRFLRVFTNDRSKYQDMNVLISNALVICLFLVLGDVLISILGNLPHFCLFQKVFSADCPACGVTRGLCSLSNGDLVGAFRLNPMSILVALFFVLQIPLRTIAILYQNTSNAISKISAYMNRAILSLILFNWIIKSIITI